MTNPPDDIRQWIQELITRSASDQLLNLKRFEEMLNRSTRGEIDPAAMQQEYMHFARDESLRYINDLTRVGLGFYNTLLELNRNYNDRFFNQVLHHQNGQPGSPAGERNNKARVIEMDLHGAVGGYATRSFIIENKRTEPVSVSFLVSEFSAQGNGASFRPPMQLTPPRFALRPGQEQPVTVQVPLLPEFFTPGRGYSAMVVVNGFEEMQIHLNIWTDPVEEAVISPQPEPARSDSPAAVKNVPVAIPDDLTQIKGIGRAFQRKLEQAGVSSFARLAAADDLALEKCLGANGLARATHNRWREQARLAAEGDWDALLALQQTLA